MAGPFPHGADARLLVARDLLSQLFPTASGQQLDLLLRSIDKDLQVPLRADASISPNLIVTIGSAEVNNTVSGRQRSIPHIVSAIPIFTGGTVTFPAANGGNITPSAGSPVNLICPIGNFVKVLISLDSTGNLVISQGAASGTEAGALVPPPVSNTLAICFVSIFNNSGTIQPIAQNKIFQLTGGGGGGGTPETGFAQEPAVTMGVSTFTVVFPSTLPDVNYVPQVALVNYVDPTPQFQEVVVVNKTTTGFTAIWNAPTDSANYQLAYLVPTIQEQVGEKDVPVSVDTITIALPIDLTANNYVVIAQLVNYSGDSPQFQPAITTVKTNTDFTVSWNAPTDSANYKIAYRVAVIQ